MGFLGGLALLPTIASLAPPAIATPIIESMFFHQKLEHQVSAKAPIAQQFQIQKHHSALSRSCRAQVLLAVYRRALHCTGS
jgi:hypothetical protein